MYGSESHDFKIRRINRLCHPGEASGNTMGLAGEYLKPYRRRDVNQNIEISD